MSIMILGHSRHGKDTYAEMLCRNDPALSFKSSSLFCAERVMMPLMNDQYQTALECFEDRHNHMQAWHEGIAEYNAMRPTRVACELFAQYDIYVGMRAKRELAACMGAGMLSSIIWVDAYPRKPKQDRRSMDITYEWVRDHPARTCPLILIDNSVEDVPIEEAPRHVEDFYYEELQG